jgi:hypothetical protein
MSGVEPEMVDGLKVPNVCVLKRRPGRKTARWSWNPSRVRERICRSSASSSSSSPVGAPIGLGADTARVPKRELPPRAPPKVVDIGSRGRACVAERAKPTGGELTGTGGGGIAWVTDRGRPRPSPAPEPTPPGEAMPEETAPGGTAAPGPETTEPAPEDMAIAT